MRTSSPPLLFSSCPAGAEPPGRGGGGGGFVPQRLQQPADAERARRRAEQDRHDLALAGLLGEIGEDGLAVGHLVHQQLLEQSVVMVGELFEHLAALERLAVGEIGGNFLLLAGLAGLIIISPLERDIDEAGDLLSLADRDPARDQRQGAHRLKRLQQALDRAARLIDLVDEDHVRDAERLQLPERRLGEQGAVGVGIDDDDGEVGDRRPERAVGGEADRSRAIDQRIMIAHIIEVQEVELGRSAARPGFGAGVAGAGAVGHRSLAPARARRKKKGLG